MTEIFAVVMEVSAIVVDDEANNDNDTDGMEGDTLTKACTPRGHVAAITKISSSQQHLPRL